MTDDDERLTLDGVDGADLLLRTADGRRLHLAVDDDVRDAVRRSRSRSAAAPAGPEEGTMDTPLRPRDIQARIRAGATAEEVAEISGATVDKVLVYARPVLAERAHMAQRAQRSSVRRTGGEAGGHRTLGDAVAARLRAIDADPDAVEWDSRKREDGRWALTASYVAGEVTGLGRFTFDPPGNFVTVDDDDARWLLGDDPAAVQPDPEPEPAPRLVAVTDDELPLGGDALRLVEDSGDEQYATYSVEADLLHTPESQGVAEPDAPERDDAAPAATDEQPDPEAGEEGTGRRRSRKRGRSSVPSWDEIMFGGGRKE